MGVATLSVCQKYEWYGNEVSSVVVAVFSVLFRVCPMPCQLDVSESKTPSSFIEYSTKVKTTSPTKKWH